MHTFTRKHESIANFDSRGRLNCSLEELHLLVQQKMLGKIGTGQGMRGAFKVFGPSPEGIGLTRFREMLTTVGIQLPKSDALRLFSKYDDDGSGHIDMYELMRNLLPSDYKGKTWQQKSFERTTNHHDDKNTERKMQGAKYHMAIRYPSGLRNTMEPSIKDVEQMIRFKIESNAKDGRERDYALKMFGRPVNGISRPNLQRALEKHSIPCSAFVLDSIFDSLQTCGLVDFDRLWHRVMPIDGRVTIGSKSNAELFRSKKKKKKKKNPFYKVIYKPTQGLVVGKEKEPEKEDLQDILDRSKKRRKDRNNHSSRRSSKRRGASPHNSLMSSSSLPSISNKSRKYSLTEIQEIIRERISSHHNMETFSQNCFDRKSEISFKVFRAGLKRLGVPATKAQANVLFSKYDHNTGLVNHRMFFRDITQPKQKIGMLQRRTINALYEQQRGWTPPKDGYQINIRVVKTPTVHETTRKQHTTLHKKRSSTKHAMLSPLVVPETKHKKRRSGQKKKPFYNVIYKQTKIW